MAVCQAQIAYSVRYTDNLLPRLDRCHHAHLSRLRMQTWLSAFRQLGQINVHDDRDMVAQPLGHPRLEPAHRHAR